MFKTVKRLTLSDIFSNTNFATMWRTINNIDGTVYLFNYNLIKSEGFSIKHMTKSFNKFR